MTLVVEDGTGKADANSYASLATANEYATLRGLSSWTGTDAEKEAALIRATDYMEATYREAWKGYRGSAEQALSWPRDSVEVDYYPVPADSVPSIVAVACIQLAARALTADLLADQTQRVKREKVDVLEVEYADGSDPATRYPFISRILAPYLIGGSNEGGGYSARVVRT